MSIFAVMIGSFTLLLTQGFEQGWFSAFSFICLSIFIITTLIFIIIERRHEVPLLISQYYATVRSLVHF